MDRNCFKSRDDLFLVTAKEVLSLFLRLSHDDNTLSRDRVGSDVTTLTMHPVTTASPRDLCFSPAVVVVPEKKRKKDGQPSMSSSR